MVLNQDTVPLRGHLALSEDIFHYYKCECVLVGEGVLPASSRQGCH